MLLSKGHGMEVLGNLMISKQHILGEENKYFKGENYEITSEENHQWNSSNSYIV